MSSSDSPTSHDLTQSLLAAWLLNACTAPEATDVEAHLQRCDRCTAEVRTLLPVVAGLSGTEPQHPPAADPLDPFARIAAASFARRPPAPRDLPRHIRPYAAQLATLDALLGELDHGEWQVETTEGWSVAQLVAHLASTDSLLAEEIGGRASSPLALPGESIASRTASYTAWAAAQPSAVVHSAWRTQAHALSSTAAHGPPDSGTRLVALTGGPPLPVADQLIGRAFETWVHTLDIALRTGHRLPPPIPESLNPIADLGVRLLPLAMRARGTPLGERVLRVELTGPAGGTWLLDDAGAATGPAHAGLTLDTVEFCLLAGGRRDPARLATHTRLSGDHSLATSALAAAPAFSGP